MKRQDAPPLAILKAAPVTSQLNDAARQIVQVAHQRAHESMIHRGPFDDLFKVIWADMDIDLIPD